MIHATEPQGVAETTIPQGDLQEQSNSKAAK